MRAERVVDAAQGEGTAAQRKVLWGDRLCWIGLGLMGSPAAIGAFAPPIMILVMIYAGLAIAALGMVLAFRIG